MDDYSEMEIVKGVIGLILIFGTMVGLFYFSIVMFR